MLKRLLKAFVGDSAWFRLTQFKIEFSLRNKIDFWDPELGLVLGKILPTSGKYVDVGAHDGRSSSNTFGLEARGWTGVLVEPILAKYFRILQLRGEGANRIYHAACVGEDYPANSVSFVYADLMSFSPEISTVDSKTWTEGAAEFLNSQEVSVLTYSPARTLNSILNESDEKYYDFLSIDVEGAELQVLKGLDLNIFTFGVICIESMNTEKVNAILTSYGYVLTSQVKQNLIYVLKP